MKPNPRDEHATWVRAALERYEGPLVLYATRIVGDVNRARDVVQEVFLRLCAQRTEDVDGHLAQWLYTVCRNKAVDVQRKESRMSLTQDAALDARTSAEPGPAEVAERRDAASQVLRTLDALPTKEQDVLRLKFQHGLSYREISGVTGLSVSHVGVLIHTGMKKLRERLGGAAARASTGGVR